MAAVEERAHTRHGLHVAERQPPVGQAGGRAERRWQLAFFTSLCCVLLMMLLGPMFLPPRVDNQHYVYLAESLLRGQFTVDGVPGTYVDIVEWNGHKYLPLGPLPAVMLIPFLPLIHLGVGLVWIGYLLTLLNVWLLHSVLGAAGVEGERRRWALLLFFGGTVYVSVAVVGSSYFVAHILTITLLLLAMREVLTARRPWLVGLFIGLAGMTRLTTIFCLPFFLWLMWRHSPPGASSVLRASRLWASYGQLAVGLAGPLLVLAGYNYARFGNPLESGYNLAVVTLPAFIEARAQGLFSLAHLPKNLYMMLLQGPVPYPSAEAGVLKFPYVVPSPWGMGLFFTTPALIYAFQGFRSRLREPIAQACWLGILVALVPIITYYGVGWIQFGYRYALDFLPLALLLAARGLPERMNPLSKSLVLASVAVCTWGAFYMLIWIHIAGG